MSRGLAPEGLRTSQNLSKNDEKPMILMIFWKVLDKNLQMATRTEAIYGEGYTDPGPSAQKAPKGVSKRPPKPLKNHENHQNIMKFHQILLLFS